MTGKHKHRWVLDTALDRFRCEVEECEKTMTRKQHATLGTGRAVNQAKLATRRAQREGADLLTGNEPATPDTGALGPKVVDTPYDQSTSSAPSGSDQSTTSPDQSVPPVGQPPTAGTAPVSDQSTGKRKSGLGRALRLALGLED